MCTTRSPSMSKRRMQFSPRFAPCASSCQERTARVVTLPATAVSVPRTILGVPAIMSSQQWSWCPWLMVTISAASGSMAIPTLAS